MKTILAACLAIAACTPAQQTQTTLGLICALNASGGVLAVAKNADPAATKAVEAAVSAGGTLLTDAACQAAIAGMGR